MIEADSWVIWVAVGLAMLVAEIVAPGVFLMWLGLAAIGTGLLAVLVEAAISPLIQAIGLSSHGLPFGFGPRVVAFALLATVSVLIGLKLRVPQHRLNTQSGGLIGRSTTALTFDGHEGRVRVGDSDWSARIPAGEIPPAPGAHLRVEAVEGTILVVKPEAP